MLQPRMLPAEPGSAAPGGSTAIQQAAAVSQAPQTAVSAALAVPDQPILPEVTGAAAAAGQRSACAAAAAEPVHQADAAAGGRAAAGQQDAQQPIVSAPPQAAQALPAGAADAQPAASKRSKRKDGKAGRKRKKPAEPEQPDAPSSNLQVDEQTAAQAAVQKRSRRNSNADRELAQLEVCGTFASCMQSRSLSPCSSSPRSVHSGFSYDLSCAQLGRACSVI